MFLYLYALYIVTVNFPGQDKKTQGEHTSSHVTGIVSVAFELNRIKYKCHHMQPVRFKGVVHS